MRRRLRRPGKDPERDPAAGVAAPPPSPAHTTPPTPPFTGRALLSVVIFLVGVWVVFAPRVLGYTDQAPAYPNDVVVGAAVALVNVLRFFLRGDRPALRWLTGILGAWLIVAPFVLGHLDRTAAAVSDIVAGSLVLVLLFAQQLRRGTRGER